MHTCSESSRIRSYYPESPYYLQIISCEAEHINCFDNYPPSSRRTILSCRRIQPSSDIKEPEDGPLALARKTDPATAPPYLSQRLNLHHCCCPYLLVQPTIHAPGPNLPPLRSSLPASYQRAYVTNMSSENCPGGYVYGTLPYLKVT